MEDRTCSVDGCESAAQKSRTICRTHRARKQKYGTYEDPKPTALQRFNDGYRVDASGCWLWLGFLNDHGYGQIQDRGVASYAHRWSYQTFIGPIADGLQIDHLCRVRSCVNPNHLEPVTPLLNNRRGESPWSVNARKTHCIRGHEFTAANTRVSRQGWRSCRQCERIGSAARYVPKTARTA